MRNAFFALALCSACSLHAAERLPSDVRQFIEQRDACDHFRNEIPEPEDVARMQEVMQQIDKLCLGTDARLARLKKKYRKAVRITRRLNRYDEHIEPQQTRLND